MKQSAAWIVQVESDFAAGEKFFQQNNPVVYCQAIAKYQQVVEKAVKAMVAAVNELGSNITITRSHLPIKEMDALLSLRRAIDNASVTHIAQMFKTHRKAVEGLCDLAPQWPDDNVSFARNTEYPFQVDGKWTAPAREDSFTLQETEIAKSTAEAFHQAAIDLVYSVKFGRL